MVQGTSSSVGKSILVAALCRIFRQDGYSCAPFKSQNMALNSFATAEGLEIGRAQAVQAEAAGIPPTVNMNPVLLKPEADSRCQVVVMGKPYRTISARDYYRHTTRLLKIIEQSLSSLMSACDIVVMEGAGSPAEINLKEREIVNMRIAALHDTPVLLVGDIDRGGVFASLLGTLDILEESERNLVQGLVINKFRGDLSLLTPGLDFLKERSGKPVLGVIPYLKNLGIAQEDSVYLDGRQTPDSGGGLRIAVIRFPHISNYDDFDPLEAAGCSVFYVNNTCELGEPHMVIMPGTKSTITDLQYLKASGLADGVSRLAEKGTPIIGICGGFQMLGRTITDTEGIESASARQPGLGLLDVATGFTPVKSTVQVTATTLPDTGLFAGLGGQEVTGYEIHMGRTTHNRETAVFRVQESPSGPVGYTDGAFNRAGTVFGTYIHGLFDNASFLKGFLANLRRYHGLGEDSLPTSFDREAAYDRLADEVRSSLDMPALYRITGL